MKKVLFTIALMLLPMLASADAVEIDGLYYNLDTEAMTAEVTEIPEKYIELVTIPETFEYGGTTYSVTSIGRYAFRNCQNLTSVIIPGSVTSIGEKAFMYCYGLASVTIPDGLTSIGVSAFLDCGLTSITIPSSVTSIGRCAFASCYGLTSFTVDEANTAYKCVDGVLMSKDGATLVAFPAGKGKTETSYTIPDGVTGIGEYAFAYCHGLTSVTIGSGVTAIGYCAFYQCYDLTTVTIGNSTTSIGEGAFDWCISLTSITVNEANPSYKSLDGVLMSKDGTTLVAYPVGKTETAYIIPDGVTSIGKSAFSNCSSLTSVTIPDGVISIGKYAFSYCRSLSDVFCHIEYLPRRRIDSSAFDNSDIGKNATLHVPAGAVEAYKATKPWNQFKEIVTLEGVEPVEIDGIYYILDNEARVAKVTQNPDKYQGDVAIPETFEYGGKTYSVTSIGDYAFSDCRVLTSVTIPDGVTSIGANAFYECSSMTSITIPDGVTSIGANAFFNCRGMTSITIPDGVTTIGDCAFCDCRGLTSVTIGSGLTSIGESAFASCFGLTAITVDEANTSYKSEDGVLMSKDGKTLVAYPHRRATAYIIPDGITTIGGGAFASCYSLTSITIPDGVTTIGNYAFSDCSGLTSITIPDGVTEIGDGAFDGCYGLTAITIPEGVTKIDKETFSNCSRLTSVTIPGGMTSIGRYAFYDCRSLSDVLCHTKEVPTTASDTFEGSNIGNATLHVPEGSVEAYMSTEPWSNFGKIVVIGSEPVTTIPAEEAVPGETVTTENGITISLGEDDEVNKEEGSIKVKTTMTPDEVKGLLKEAKPDEPNFYEVFKGIYSKKSAGRGYMKIECETLGDYELTVMLGTEKVANYTQSTRGFIKIQYLFDADEWVFIFPTISAAARAKMGRDPIEGGLKIYSVTFVPSGVMPGDANDDGVVDATDIVEVVNALMGSPSENYNEEGADANEDGVINAADIVTIVNMIMGNSSN